MLSWKVLRSLYHVSGSGLNDFNCKAYTLFAGHLSAFGQRASFATQRTYKYIYYLFSLFSLYHLPSIVVAWLNCIDFHLLPLCLLPTCTY